MSVFSKCKHGFEANDPRYVGKAMAAPYTTCDCCGRTQFYIDSYIGGGPGNWKSTNWTKNKCDGCGGKYIKTSSAPKSNVGGDDGN